MIDVKYILIVDDEPLNRLLLNLKIKDYESPTRLIEVYEAVDGLESIATTREMMKNEKDISLIFMDWRMPNLTGVEAAERIKKEYSNIPIILHSAHIDVKRVYDKYKQFDELLEKPINEKIFEHILTKYLK